jgi:hypothetical protein
MPESVSNTDSELAASAAENAAARNDNLANATKATTGNAGLAEGNAAKRALLRKGPRF